MKTRRAISPATAKATENRQIQLRRSVIPPDTGLSQPHKALTRAGKADTLEPLALDTRYVSPGGPEGDPSDCSPPSLLSPFDLSSIHTKPNSETETPPKSCLVSRGLKEAKRAETLVLGLQ